MTARAAVHPSAESLQAYGIGKLADSTVADSIYQHLETCAECRNKVAAVTGDDFVLRMRNARRDGAASYPTRGGHETAADRNAAGQVTTGPPFVPDLPPELRNHPQYEVQRELGHGGMGVVYLARNKLMDRLEVLKVAYNKRLGQAGDIQRFLREIRSAAKLSHPNVVTAYNALQLGELLAFAMEFVPGDDLVKVVKNYGKPLPVPTACYYAREAALGLQHAFEKSMVHRDIKPQNIILAREGKKHIIKILDFGLAKARSEGRTQLDLTGVGQALGTPAYMPPEQWLDSARADIRADIYSLGCTLHFLLTGSAPFSAQSEMDYFLKHQTEIAKPLNEVRADVPAELAAVVAKMIAKKPEDRYQTPKEVAQGLLPFLKLAGTATLPAPAPKSSTPKAGPDWAAVVEGRSTMGEPGKGKATQTLLSRPSKPGAKRKRLFVVGILAGLLLLALVGMWAGGGVKVKTKDGTIVLENFPDDAEVTVDGEKVTVTWGDSGNSAQITVKPGTPYVEVKVGGITVVGQKVIIEDGGRKVLWVRREVQPIVERQGKKRVIEEEEAPLIRPSQPASDKPPPEPTNTAESKEQDGAAGFVRLFNGKDLTGWNYLSDHWRVDNGVLIGYAGPEGLKFNTSLCSTNKYKDFELSFQVKLTGERWRGNSGVNFRSVVYDRERWDVEGPQADMGDKCWGNLFGENFGGMMKQASEQLIEKLVRPDDFNDFYIKCVGKHVTIKLNGETTVDDDFPKIPDEGIIAWQLHKGPPMEVRFRNVKFHDLGDVKASDDFVQLFNRKDRTGWKTHPKQPGNWRVVKGTNGNILTGSGQTSGYLYTERGDYKDFHLRAEARINDGGNSGVLFRCAFSDVMKGYEADINTNNRFLCKTGSLYKAGKPALVVNELLASPNQWFLLEVIAKGNHIVIKVNGKTTVDFIDPEPLESRGFIALQQHDPQTEAEFRKIEIKELPAKKPD
jgi:serine/threonine protein kinase